MRAIRLHRVEALLAPWVRDLGMDGTRILRIASLAGHLTTMGRAVADDAGDISSTLTSANIDNLVVKGGALMAALGLDPAIRGWGDVDLWVRPADAARVEQILLSHGWVRVAAGEHLPTLSGGMKTALLRRFVNENAYDHPTRTTIDLHWKLAADQREFCFDFDDAWSRRSTVTLGQSDVHTLCLDDALVHMSQHGRKEAWPSLRHLVDIVRIVDAIGPRRAAEIATEHVNVANAVLLASKIAPWMNDALPEVSGTQVALRDSAWAACLSLRNHRANYRALVGADARRHRRRHDVWLWRSAPTWRTRVAWLMRRVTPQALLLHTNHR